MMDDIQFTPEHVIKRQSVAAAARERERTEVGRRIAESSRRFSVPRIEGYDAASGTLTFERILDAVRLTELLPAVAPADAARIAGRAGAALAAIHDSARSTPDARASAGDDRAAAGEVCLHGDFALGNLLFGPVSDELFIIDWNGARWLEETAAGRGPAALDLSIFLLSLFYRRPMGPLRTRSPEQIARAFLASYTAGRADGYESRELSGSFPAILERYAVDRRRARGPLRALVHLPGLWRVRRFVLNLPEDLESLEH